MTAVADDATSRLDLRLVPAAVAAWTVTGAGIFWPTTGSVGASLAAVATAAAGGWWASARWQVDMRTVGTIVVAVGVVATAFGIAVGLRVHELRHHPLTTRYGTVATVVVTPTESPRVLGGNRTMFRGSLVQVDTEPVSGRVVVFASSTDMAALTAGTPVAFRARIGRPTRRDLSVAVLSATGKPTYGEAAAIHRAAHAVRAGFADAARRALPADQAAILPALVLGDTAGLSPQTAAEFRAAGLTHLTAVSGANVTIVCGAVLLSAGLVGPRMAVLLAAVALTAFVIVVQPTASVLRAAVMGAVTLLAVLSHRRRQAMPALSASVLVLLIAAPELAVDAGFALSVTATAALIVIAPVWSLRLVGRGWPKPLADAVSVAVAAQLVTAPLVAGISGIFSVVSVAANVAAAVVIAPITVAGTAAAAMFLVWPSGAELLIRFTGPELWWLLGVARWASAVPGSSVSVPAGLVGVLTVAGVGAVAVMAWRWRWVRLVAGAAAVCLLAWTVSGLSGGRDTIGG